MPPDFTSALLIQPHENMLMSKLAVFQYINKVNCLIIGYELSETNIVKTEKHSLYSNVYSLFSDSTKQTKKLSFFFLADLKSWDLALSISDSDPVRRKQTNSTERMN